MAMELDPNNLIMYNKPYKCEKCGGKLQYLNGGQYECVSCRHIEYDDFGKIKLYLTEHGRAPAVVIARETGVKKNVIETFLKTGRLEIPQGSNHFIKCEGCGCDIRYGRFCPKCGGGDDGPRVSQEYIGERPKNVPQGSAGAKGKMRFRSSDRQF